MHPAATDTLTCDTARLARWWTDPAYDYERALRAAEECIGTVYEYIQRHGLQRQERTADRLDRIHRTHGVFRDNDAQIVVTIIGWRTISTGAKEINCLGFDSFRDNPAHRLQFVLQGFRLC